MSSHYTAGYHRSHHSQPAHSQAAYAATHGGPPSHGISQHGPASYNPQSYGHSHRPYSHGPQRNKTPQPSAYGAGSHHHNHGGNAAHPNRNQYGKSSLFVPADWNYDSSKAGFANLIGRILTNLDYQYNSMEHLPMHGVHGAAYGPMLGHGSVMGHPGAMGSHYAPSASHHSMHPAAAHAVSVVSDPHGMFSLGNMARMSMARGHARFSSKSMPTICPRCKSRIMTLVKRRPDGINITAAAAAVIFGLIFKLPKALLPLTFVPLQMRSLQPCIHYCPRCNYKLGKNVRVYISVDDMYQ